MKKSSLTQRPTLAIILLLLIGLTFSATAQNTQKGFSFQGFARDFDGAAYSSSNITAKFSIYPVGLSTVDYTEEQSLTTDAYGVFNAIIGSVSAVDFGALDFSAKNYKMKVEVKVTGGEYVIISDSELLAVPYAKAADKAGNGTPPGTVISFAGATAPDGYLLCNGQEVSQASYPKLYAAIGDLWGAAGAGNFKLPDLRGQFLRGKDSGAGIDPDVAARTDMAGNTAGDVVGSYQTDAFQGHYHNLAYNAHNTTFGGTVGSDHFGLTANSIITNRVTDPITDGTNGDTRTTSETRPTNAYVLYVIKY